MEQNPAPISEKAKKLKLLNNYEGLLSLTGKLFEEIQDDNANASNFKIDLDEFIHELINEVSGQELLFIRMLSSLETPSPFISHSLNTAIFSFIISSYIEIDTHIQFMILTAALLHDIGKINFSEKIKALYIYRDEAPTLIQQNHPVWGERLCLSYLKLSPEIARLVLNHHEQNDGSGYPRHLKENELTIYDQIIIAANLIDNILQKTHYNSFDTMQTTVQKLMDSHRNIFSATIRNVFNDIFSL